MTDRQRVPRAWRRGTPLVCADDVFREWMRMARARTPWRDMYLDDASGQLRSVLAELLHPGEETDGDGHYDRLRRRARAHGRFRRTQGCSGQVVAAELEVVEEAICLLLLRGGAPDALVSVLFDGLARDCRSVERAIYGGFVD
jgi:hypothetical protein